MDDYKPNSYKSKEERKNTTEDKKKVEKVVNGKVVSKKKSEIRKLVDIFVPEDVQNVKEYIFVDVLVPEAKKVITDIVDAILYGGSPSKKSTNADRVSYGQYYKRERERSMNRPQTRSSYSYDDIVLNNRGEAEEVLSRMVELIDDYGLVSVADLYDLVGVTGNYTDCKYGWTDLSNASVIRDKDGYMLKLPRVIPLN